jgi:hypothetical protein
MTWIMAEDAIEILFWTCCDHHIVMMMMIYHKFDELLIMKILKLCVENVKCYYTNAYNYYVHKHNTKKQSINLLILINRFFYFCTKIYVNALKFVWNMFPNGYVLKISNIIMCEYFYITITMVKIILIMYKLFIKLIWKYPYTYNKILKIQLYKKIHFL